MKMEASAMGHRKTSGLRHHRGRDGKIYWYTDTHFGGRPPKGCRIYVRHGAVSQITAEAAHRELLELAWRRAHGLGQPANETTMPMKAEMTFSEAGRLWVNALKSVGREQATVTNYTFILSWANKYLGSRPMAEIRLEDLEAMRVAIRESNLSFRTRRSIEHVSSSLFKFAMHPERGWADRNPFSALILEKPPKRRERKGELFKKLHPREDKKLLGACLTDWHRAAIAIGLYLGVRKTPVASLRLEDVNLFIGAVRVPCEFNKGHSRDIREDQWLPIPEHLRPHLERQVKNAEKARTPWLFPTGAVRGKLSKTGHIFPGKLCEIVKRTAARVGYKDANFHALRTICNNRVRASGIAEALDRTAHGARGILGHASEQSAAPYIDAQVEYLKPIIEAYDRWLSEKEEIRVLEIGKK